MSRIHFKTENAVQMYARFNQKPNLSLNIPIFEENLKPGSIYEIIGKSGSGKTAVLYEILCKLLMPKDIDNGLNVGVIFIDNDRHFNLWRLGALLEFKCQRNVADGSKIETVVRDCLKRLLFVTCDDSQDFFNALDHVETGLFKNRNLASVLIVDSISAFILFDQCDEKSSTIDRENLRSVHQMYVYKLKRLANELNLIVVVTQFMLTITTDDNDERNGKKLNETSSIAVMDKCWRNAVHSRIQLDNSTPNEDIFTVRKSLPNGQLGELLCKFKINQTGLTFF